jgi:aminopeptidase YwaD
MLRLIRYILVIPFTFSTFLVLSQNVTQANETVQILCSDEFAGRGYVDSGDRVAANYIAKQFKSLSLKSFEKGYKQPFDLSVNNINSTKILLDNKQLKPGFDYLVAPNSPTISGDYQVFYISQKMLYSNHIVKKVCKAIKRGYVPVISRFDKKDQALKKTINEIQKLSDKGPIIFLKDKLTWSVSTTQSKGVEIWMLDSGFNRFSKDIRINITSTYISSYESNNVVGYVEGVEYPDSFIILCGHYDHLGKMGDAIFYGANDNASGIAMLLDLASYFSEHPQKYSVAFIAFGGEELGLLGSLNYVRNPSIPLYRTKFVFNMDLMGDGSKGATIVNGKIYKSYFEQLTKINSEGSYLPAIRSRGKAANSDHYFFSEAGVPSFFIYLMGDYDFYHIPQDNARNLKLGEFYNQSFLLIRKFITELN